MMVLIELDWLRVTSAVLYRYDDDDIFNVWRARALARVLNIP